MIQKASIQIIIILLIIIIVTLSTEYSKQIPFQIKNPYHYIPFIDNQYNITYQIYKEKLTRFQKILKPDYFIQVAKSLQHKPGVIFDHQYKGNVQINNNMTIKQKAQQAILKGKQVILKGKQYFQKGVNMAQGIYKDLSKKSVFYYVLIIDSVLFITLVSMLICYWKTNNLDCCNKFWSKIFRRRAGEQLSSQQNIQYGIEGQIINDTSLQISKNMQKNESSSDEQQQQQDNKIIARS